MLWVREVTFLRRESVSWVTTKMTATPVIPESGLVQEDTLMTPTRVETKQRTHRIMETNTSKPLDIFWFSEKENNHDDKPLSRLP